jgi:hypothetical protein
MPIKEADRSNQPGRNEGSLPGAEKRMLKHKRILSMLFVGILILGALGSSGFAQGEYSVSLGDGVTADPGQSVALGLTVTSPDSLGGLDALLEFDPVLLSFDSFEPLYRIQYITVNGSQPGKLRLIIRRQHADSVRVTALAPGIDTLGLIWLRATTQDLLMDVEATVSFFEDGGTSLDDNRLVKKDSTAVVAPQLLLMNGVISIRHPLYGDVNGDGYANTVADAIFLANYLAGIQKLTSVQRANADVNRDGFQGGMTDFIELIRIIIEE